MGKTVVIDANGWNDDMDAAPKDGTPFLGYSSRVSECAVIKWAEYLNCFRPTVFDGLYVEGEGVSDFCDPTHWRPLPPPPSTEQG